ncbi:alcohol dehydrogenase catalytic domain-containing protein [Streptomyces sp.]|uniref:alcohol dehydrogenase catalytic domain-containing protein n=1 Tax=Streptomyces sp. TaxID=1931 RepID=UPI0025DF6BE8|nr:alcohol dehydrogenase catalytic domain-containing protein [Streptomyces sp.]
MLAGRVHLDTKKFLMEEIPIPEPGPGEVLIEVKAAGVCLSDLHLIDGVGITTEPLKISERMTFNLKNKRVYGHYGSSFDHVYELIRLASSGRLDLAPSITDHIPLADAPEAIHRLEHKIGDPIRLILVP